MVVDRGDRDKSQGGVVVAVAVAVAGMRTYPGKDSADEEGVPAVEQEEVPGSSFAPGLG